MQTSMLLCFVVAVFIFCLFFSRAHTFFSVHCFVVVIVCFRMCFLCFFSVLVFCLFVCLFVLGSGFT